MNALKMFIAIAALVSLSSRVESQPNKTNRLQLGGKRSPTIDQLAAWQTEPDRSSRIMLVWRRQGSKHRQIIRLPSPWYCANYPDDPYRPTGVQLQVSGEPALMIVANRPSGVYDVRSPIFYSLHGSVWRRIASRPKQSEFTDLGSCRVKNGRLYAWDYEMAEHKGHADPQRYWLRVFSISRQRVQLKSNRMTRHIYDGVADSEGHNMQPSWKIARRDDPLHEFGLRWKWWGDR